jgi:hypothetical protein
MFASRTRKWCIELAVDRCFEERMGPHVARPIGSNESPTSENAISMPTELSRQGTESD